MQKFSRLFRGFALMSITTASLLSLTGCNKTGYIGIDKDDPKPGPVAPLTAGPAAALQIIGPSSVSVGTCQRLDVQIIDVNGLVAASYPASLTSFQLSANVGGSAQIFSDSSCTTPTSSVPVQSGGTAPFFVKDAIREFVTFSALTLPVTLSGSRTLQFTAGAPAALDLSVNPANATNVCVAVTVKALDVSGNATPTHSGVGVSLNLTGIVQAALFSDSGCLTQISSTTIPAGSDSKIFYVQSQAVGNATLSASSAGLTPDSAAVTFVAGTSPQIVMSGPTGNLTAGQCALVQVLSQRFDGSALVAVGGSLPVALNVVSGSSVQFFNSNLCTTAITNTTIPVNQSSTTVFVKTALAPQTVTVSGTSAGFASVPTNLTFVPVAPTIVRVQGTPGSLPAGQCGQGQVALLDSVGAPAFVTANTAVNLSAGANATETDFFASNDCSGPTVTSVAVPLCSTIGACLNTAGFSFRPKKVGQLVITPASTGLTPIAASVTVVTPTGSPISLRLTRLTDPATTDTCIQYRVETIDAFGNFINMAAAFPLSTSATSLSGLGTFFSDLNCNTITSTITIAAGSHSQDFTFRNPRVESVLITLSGNPGPVVQDTVNILGGVAKKLVFNNVPTTLSASRCSSAITVTEKDQNDNSTTSAVSFTLSATNGVSYFSDSSCTQSISVGTIPAGSHTSSGIFFSGPNTGNANLTATASSPSSVTVPAAATVVMTAAPALHLGLSCDANSLSNNTCAPVAAGTCQALFITSFDNTNTKFIPVGSNIAVTLSTSAASGVTFSNASCTSAQTSVTLTNSQNPTMVFVKNNVAQAFTVTGTPSVGAAGSANLTTQPGSPFRLAISGSVGPSSFFTQQCAGPYQAQVWDAFGNLSPVTGNTAVTFGSSAFNGSGLPGNLSFSGASDCSATPVTVASGNSSTSFYVKSGTAGALSMRAGASGLNTSDIRGVTISQTADVVMIANGTQISSINFGTISRGSSSTPVVVTLKNNSLSETANMSALSGPAAPFEKITSGTTCPSTSFTLAPGQSCDVALRFSPTAVGTFNGNFAAQYVGALTNGSFTTAISLSGVAINPAFNPVYLSVSSMDFGTVNTGASRTLDMNLVNPSAYNVVVSSKNVSSGFTAVVGGTCGNSLPFTMAPNASCTVSVSFAPTAAGLRTGTINFGYTNPETNAAATTNTTSLSGTGVAVATQLSLNPGGYTFSNVPAGTTVGPVNITVTNTGSVAAINLSLTTDQAPFTVAMGSCGTTLPAGSSCALNVSFSPTAAGTFSKTVNLNYATQGGATGQSAPITLQGTATAASPTTLVINPSTWNFGSVQSGLVSSPQTITITNTGGQAADSISLNNLGTSFQVSMGTCTGTLNAGASCNVTVSFAPTVPGSYVAYVTLQYRNAVSGVTSNTGSALTLTGQATQGGSAANLYPDVSAINYGSIRIGQTSTRWTLITNSGTTTATNLTMVASSDYTSNGFTASLGTCGSTLAAGQSCYVNLGVVPRFTGLRTGTVAVRYKSNGAGADLQTISISTSVYGY